MDYVIGLGPECEWIARSRPTFQLRLLLAAVGRPLVSVSPRTVVNKRLATRTTGYSLRTAVSALLT